MTLWEAKYLVLVEPQCFGSMWALYTRNHRVTVRMTVRITVRELL